MLDKLDKKQKIKLAAAIVMLAIASAVTTWRFMQSRDSGPPVDFFYDLSERELFTAPKDAIPPIRGINDEQEDGVRAVVIAADGNPKTRGARKIVYLETNSPQLKAALVARNQAMARGEKIRGFDRQFVRANTMVRAPDEQQWYSITSQEGLDIVSALNQPGPDGKYPVICQP